MLISNTDGRVLADEDFGKVNNNNNNDHFLSANS